MHEPKTYPRNSVNFSEILFATDFLCPFELVSVVLLLQNILIYTLKPLAQQFSHLQIIESLGKDVQVGGEGSWVIFTSA